MKRVLIFLIIALIFGIVSLEYKSIEEWYRKLLFTASKGYSIDTSRMQIISDLLAIYKYCNLHYPENLEYLYEIDISSIENYQRTDISLKVLRHIQEYIKKNNKKPNNLEELYKEWDFTKTYFTKSNFLYYIIKDTYTIEDPDRSYLYNITKHRGIKEIYYDSQKNQIYETNINSVPFRGKNDRTKYYIYKIFRSMYPISPIVTYVFLFITYVKLGGYNKRTVISFIMEVLLSAYVIYFIFGPFFNVS